MPHWIDQLPRQELIEVMRHLYAHQEASVCEYITVKGFDEHEISYPAIHTHFIKLKRLGFIKAERRSGIDVFCPAVTLEEFQERCVRVVLEHLFENDTTTFRRALERIEASSKRKSPKRK